MSANIILTTGIYDLIKDHVRRRKVTKEEEEILLNELKSASQVTRKELPTDVVTIDRLVSIKKSNTNETVTVTFVSPDKAKPNKNKLSILSDIGIAVVGYKTGDVVKWPSKDGEIEYEILSVEEIK